jgi:HEAT repeat protein
MAGLGAKTPTSPNSQQAQAAETISNTDLSHWSYWWYFNKDELLNLKVRFRGTIPSTGAQAPPDSPLRPADSLILDVILPALMEAIAEDKTSSVAATSYIALGRIGHPGSDEIFNTLLNGARDRDPEAREAALLSLGIQGDPRALPILLQILGNEKSIRAELKTSFNDRARSFAAYGLAIIAARAENDDKRRMILLSLLSHFEDTKESQDVRVAILQALGKMSLPFADPRRALDVAPRDEGDEEPFNVRSRDLLLDRLWRQLESEDDRVVLGHLPVVFATLAAGAPSAIRAKSIARLLERMEDKPQRHELAGLVTALGRIGSAWGKPEDLLVRSKLYSVAKESDDHHARHLAFMALAEACNRGEGAPVPTSVSHEFESFLIERSEKGRTTDKSWISLAAGVHGARMKASGSSPSDEFALHLRVLLNEARSTDEASAAALACGLSEDARSGEVLEKLFTKFSNPSVLGYASLAMGLIGEKDAKAKLWTLVHKFRYQPQPLENVALGLGLLAREEAGEYLRESFTHTASSASSVALANAIGQLADAASAPSLAQIARNSKLPAEVRAAAAGALGLLAESSDLPWRSELSQGINYNALTRTLFDGSGMGVLNFF